jgi:hypothetical protein
MILHGLASDHDPPILASCAAGMVGVSGCTQPRSYCNHLIKGYNFALDFFPGISFDVMT